MQAKEIMHRGIDFIAPDCSVRDAARMMKRLNIGALPVCEGPFLVGMLTDRDIVVRALAEGRDPAGTAAAEIMTKDPIRCYQDAELSAVARLMEDRKIRRIPVVNRRERLVGMLSIDDFTRRGPAADLLAEILESAAAKHA
jgi:CBS domain-containing protein